MDPLFELKQSQLQSSTAEILRFEDMVSVSKDDSIKVQSWRKLLTPYKEALLGSLSGTLYSVQSSCASAKLDDIRKSLSSYRAGLNTYGTPSKLASLIQPLTEEEESSNCTVDSSTGQQYFSESFAREVLDGEDDQELTPEMALDLANHLKGQPNVANFTAFLKRARVATENRTPKPKAKGSPEPPEEGLKVLMLTEAVKSCEAQIKSLNSLVYSFQGVVKQLHERWAEDNSQVKALKHQLVVCSSTDTSSERDSQLAELQRKATADTEKIKALEARLQNKEAEAEASSRRAADLEVKNAKLIEQLQENIEMLEEWAETNEKKKELERKLANSEDKVHRLRKERDDLKALFGTLVKGC